MNVSQGFPVPAAPLLDRDGNVTEAWRRFFLTLWNRTGEGPGISSADLELLQALFSARVELHTAAEIEAQAAFLGALAARSTPRPSQALDVAMMALLSRRVVSGAEIVAALASNAGAGAGKLLIGNTTSGGFNLGTLTAGSNVTITNGNGSISIAASGGNGTVTSVGLTSSDFTISGSPVTTSGNITANLGNTTVTAGNYTLASITVDATGRITKAANGSAASGTVTSVGVTSSNLTTGGTNPVTTSGNITVDVPANGITNALFRQGVALSVVGVTGNATANVADIAAGTDNQVLRRSGAALAFGAVNLAATAAVTGTLPIANGGTNHTAYTNGQLLIGNTTSGGLDAATLTAGSGVSITNSAGGISIASTGASITTAVLTAPQGRLTLVTGVPVMLSDQTAKTHIYYTPYTGPNVPVYGGSTWSLNTMSADLDMALDATNQPTTQIFDLFAYLSSGTLTIGCGPAWTNTATITVTIATPGVVSWTSHGLPEGSPVIFTTTGALPTGITAGTIYFVSKTSLAANAFDISTTLANSAIGTNVATTGSQSGVHTGTNHTTTRGTGAGTTELQLVNGLWTNKNSITLTNGAGAGTSVAANQATYLGSFYTTAAGQTGMQFLPAGAAGGSNNILGVWNAYNRIDVLSIESDSTASWAAASGSAWKMMDANVKNRISFIDGLQQSWISGHHQSTAGSAGNHLIGMNLNSTTASPQTATQMNGSTWFPISTDDAWPPILGLGYVQGMEWADGVGSWLGSSAGSRVQALKLQIPM